MFAALLAVAVSPADEQYLANRYPEVRLEDVRAFGVAPDVVDGLARLAHGHQPVMRRVVEAHNDPMAVARWESECDWRRECWECLRAALLPEAAADMIVDDDRRTPAAVLMVRLDRLDELRRLIGDADYRAGRMPNPTPSYRLPLK